MERLEDLRAFSVDGRSKHQYDSIAWHHFAPPFLAQPPSPFYMSLNPLKFFASQEKFGILI